MDISELGKKLSYINQTDNKLFYLLGIVILFTSSIVLISELLIPLSNAFFLIK